MLEDLIGKRLVIGIPGTISTPEIVRHFKEVRAGGLILYRINFESPEQLKKLISDLENSLEKKLLVMADHEGGRVVMFGEGVTVFPDNLALGKTKKIEYASLQGEIEAKELRRMGIDVNLSPVLDVLTETYSPNIGIRSYGQDWNWVSQMGSARIRAMQKNGLSACAKHFPGKGHAPVDAHLGLPVIHSNWEEMEQTHLQPFLKSIESGIDMIMSSHPYYPNLDPEPKTIATFSRKIIYEVLRKKLNYKGVIASDDLEMGAVKTICPIGEAALRAVHAGHDILLVCHDLNAQKEVFYTLVDAYKNKQCSLKELEESNERFEQILNIRKKRFEEGAPKAEPRGGGLAKTISWESVSILRDKKKILPLAGSTKLKKTLVLFPRFSDLAEKIMIEKEILDEKRFLESEFKNFDFKPDILPVSIEPTNEEIENAKNQIEKFERVILFCFDAHLYPSNKKMLDRVQKSGKDVIVVLLRDPYDIEYMDSSSVCLTDFGWRVCQIKSTIQKMFA